MWQRKAVFGRDKQRLIEVDRMDQKQAGRVRGRQRRLELGRKHESVAEISSGRQG